VGFDRIYRINRIFVSRLLTQSSPTFAKASVGKQLVPHSFSDGGSRSLRTVHPSTSSGQAEDHREKLGFGEKLIHR